MKYVNVSNKQLLERLNHLDDFNDYCLKNLSNPEKIVEYINNNGVLKLCDSTAIFFPGGRGKVEEWVPIIRARTYLHQCSLFLSESVEQVCNEFIGSSQELLDVLVSASRNPIVKMGRHETPDIDKDEHDDQGPKMS